PRSLRKIRYRSFYFKNDGNIVLFTNDFKILVYSHIGDELILISSRKIYSDKVREVMIEDNKIWAISSNYLFQWDLDAFQFEFSYSLWFTTNQVENVTMRGNLILVKYRNEISIFSKENHFPIRNIRIEGEVSIKILSNYYLLAFNLPKKDEKQDLRLYHTTDDNKQPVEGSKIFNDDNIENGIIPFEYNLESRRAFGFVDCRISSINLTKFNLHEWFEANHIDDDIIVGWNTYLNQPSESQCNDTLAFPDLENIKTLVSNQDKIDDTYDEPNRSEKQETLNLRATPSDTSEELCSKELKELEGFDQIVRYWRILDNNELALHQTMCNDFRPEFRCITIYKYDKSIKIKYFYFNDDENFNAENFESGLPMMDVEAFFEHKENSFVPSFDEFKCTKLVKEDPKKNLKFLNIITLSMKELYTTYPDYISKFNSEIFMILDPSSENIIDSNYLYGDLYHFYTFNEEIEIELGMSKHIRKISEYCAFELGIIFVFSTLFIPYNAPLYFYAILALLISTLLILSRFTSVISILLIFLRSVSSKIIATFYSYYYKIFERDSKVKQRITLVVPYVNYSCYTLEYNWLKEIFKPQSSVFVDTCKKDFYTNWNGEAIIDFKWKIASYSSNFITQEIRNKLYQISIGIGFLYLASELRQFIWNPKKYFSRIVNWFDLCAYLPAFLVSIYWIKHQSAPYWALSVSFILAIILASVTHAFFFLLHPRDFSDSLTTQDPSDPNNPWTISKTFHQTDENGKA
ncbi:2410_t:CDS:2, partial [Funneliformis mosseae]